MNYKDLEDREIEAILKCYDGSIQKFHRMNYLDIFEVFYKENPPHTEPLKYLNDFILDKKIMYREMRLDFMLK